MKIVNYPHPSLRHKARPFTAIDKKVQLQVGQMLDLMYEGKGLGLAGPQVMLPFEVFVMNLKADPNQREFERVWINPVIIERKGSVEGEEGCLSFPGLFAKVRRAKTIRFQAYNLKGELVEQTTESEIEARVWQHEVDHLRGELFIDKMGPIAKIGVRGSVRAFERDYRRAQERGEIPPDAEIEKLLIELENEGGKPAEAGVPM
jgi:peptide deformylase